MATRVVVDPVTRIEGHLRIEAVVENGVITDAFSAGTMVRGLEKILIGRDPRDAWAITERVCGVCTTVHALASVRSVEDALGISVPPTAELIRNIMLTTQYVQDHVIHFYHLHALDWVDIVNALKADPKKAAELAQSFSKWDKNTTSYFTEVQDKIKAFAASGMGIFANGYWGHPAYKLPPEVNLIAVAHYLDALQWQKEIVKIHAVFGGKNPHPNYLVGGVPCSIDVNELAAINGERLNLVARLISQADEFVNEVYIPDLLTVASFYKDWAKYGGGLSNYLCYGEFPTNGYSHPEAFKYARGAVLNRDLSTVLPVNPKDQQEIKEYIAHSWYTYDGGNDVGLHPWAGETRDQVRRPQAAVRYAGGLRQVLVPQDSALEREPHGSGTAGSPAGFLCRRPRGCEGHGGHGTGQAQRACRRSLQHPGTHRGARHRCGAGHDLAQGVLLAS
jgi:hydrogenase large subunit